jgi:hypothetical protein
MDETMEDQSDNYHSPPFGIGIKKEYFAIMELGIGSITKGVKFFRFWKNRE